MKKIIAFLLMFFVSNICLAKDLVIFGADWCPSCVKLKKYIKANKSKINFIVQELDFDREKELHDISSSFELNDKNQNSKGKSQKCRVKVKIIF